VKPIIAKYQVTRRVKTGDVEFVGVNIAGREPEKQAKLLNNDG
jgi:hypothetical protein